MLKVDPRLLRLVLVVVEAALVDVEPYVLELAELGLVTRLELGLLEAELDLLVEIEVLEVNPTLLVLALLDVVVVALRLLAIKFEVERDGILEVDVPLDLVFVDGRDENELAGELPLVEVGLLALDDV